MSRLSPVLSAVGTYPFVHLDEARRRVEAKGVELIDFGVGDPRETAPAIVREALHRSVDAPYGYPRAAGLPELREAVAGWCRRRFGVDLDPEREIVPTLGSKEAIFSFAHVVVDRAGGRDLVAVTEPGYPVPERGAVFAGGEPHTVALREENGFLPDLDAVGDDVWRRLALFWVNYPNNPTGVTAPLRFFERLADLARRHGFVLASDEAYTELWFDEPPPSALQLEDLRNVIVFNSLSKRSSMTGFRSGFAAGDPELIAAVRSYRPNAGTTPQEFVQLASVAAWADEKHVGRIRAAYREKREVLLEAFAARGLELVGSRATMYLWVRVPAGETSESYASRLLELGLVVSPGTFFGQSGEGYVRFALVPSLDACCRAARLLEAS